MKLGDKQGVFAWYTYETTQPQKGLDFYKNLLANEIKEMNFGGQEMRFIAAHGETFADVDTATGKNRWAPRIAVDDVDAMAQKAKRLGGKIIDAPSTMENVGRIAVVADMFGSEIGLYCPENLGEFKGSVMGYDEGQICWNELLVPNDKEAVRFYSEMFGWKFTANDMGPNGIYNQFSAGGREAGGILTTPHGAEGLQAKWMPYLAVKDIQTKTEKAKSLDAKVFMPATPIPGVGTFSVIQDPSGAVAYLFQSSRFN